METEIVRVGGRLKMEVPPLRQLDVIVGVGGMSEWKADPLTMTHSNC